MFLLINSFVYFSFIYVYLIEKDELSSTDNKGYWSEAIVLTVDLILYSCEFRVINFLHLSKAKVHFLHGN